MLKLQWPFHRKGRGCICRNQSGTKLLVSSEFKLVGDDYEVNTLIHEILYQCLIVNCGNHTDISIDISILILVFLVLICMKIF